MEMGYPLHSWQYQKGIDDSRQPAAFLIGKSGFGRSAVQLVDWVSPRP